QAFAYQAHRICSWDKLSSRQYHTALPNLSLCVWLSKFELRVRRSEYGSGAGSPMGRPSTCSVHRYTPFRVRSRASSRPRRVRKALMYFVLLPIASKVSPSNDSELAATALMSISL